MAWRVHPIPEPAGGGFVGVIWDARLHVRGAPTVPDTAITTRTFQDRRDAVVWCRSTEGPWLDSSRRIRRMLSGLEGPA